MQLEKRFYAVPPQLLLSDGTVTGRLHIADTSLFKVKQLVFLKNSTGTAIELEIKRIDSPLTMYVGPIGGSIDYRTDVSGYTAALGATVYAKEQNKTKVPEQEIERITYVEEPVCARRVHLVDQYGNDYLMSNPLPVTISNVSPTPNNPTIANIAVPLANTEYSYLIPASTKSFRISVRGGLAKLQLAFVAGKSNIEFTSIGFGCCYSIENITTSALLTAYFQCSKPNEIVEIITWSN